LAEGPVLAILFDAAPGEAPLLAVRRRHPDARLILLTTAGAAPRLAPFADEVWPEGVPRGPARFLALMRRIAWAGIVHIYDLEGRPATRFMRVCVWPRPHWHGRGALKAD
jgi:hypothetical protein